MEKILVPTFEQFMKPMLNAFSTKTEGMHVSEAREMACKEMKLSNEQMNEIAGKGGQTKVEVRAQFATYNMYRAGLLEKLGKGKYKITSLGIDENKNNNALNNNYLKKYDSFVNYLNSHKKDKESAEQIDTESDPYTKIDNIISSLNKDLEYELLKILTSDKVTPIFFERIVIKLMEKMGYGSGFETKKS
jgi:restriction system protein